MGEFAPAGIGVIIVDSSGNELDRFSEPVGKCTPNQAAFRAFVRALEEIRRRNIAFARIHSSNETLVRQIQGIYMVMDPVLKQLKNVARKKYSDVKYKVDLVTNEKSKEALALASDAAAVCEAQLKFKASPLKMTTDVRVPKEAETVQQDEQRSAGGVLYKKERNRIYVCLIYKKGRNVWALPKGRVDNNEKPEETAVREVEEETGHRSSVQADLDRVEYYFYWKDNNTFYHKLVNFYLLKLEEENFRQKDNEADVVSWMSPGEAYKKLTYIDEKEVMKKAIKIIMSMT